MIMEKNVFRMVYKCVAPGCRTGYRSKKKTKEQNVNENSINVQVSLSRS